MIRGSLLPGRFHRGEECIWGTWGNKVLEAGAFVGACWEKTPAADMLTVS